MKLGFLKYPAIELWFGGDSNERIRSSGVLILGGIIGAQPSTPGDVSMKSPTWSRREFLEVSAAASAAMAAQPFKVRPVAPSDTVRFGMVGVGMQGSGLLGTSIQLPGVTCGGAADLYDGRQTLA